MNCKISATIPPAETIVESSICENGAQLQYGHCQSDAEVLASMQASAHEKLLFFSNKGKEKRERWVVSQFLQYYKLDFNKTELVSPPQNSKTDVQFRDANFQIKEIINAGEKRSDEIRATYKCIKNASKLEEVIGPSFIYDIPPPTTIYSLVMDEAKRLASIPKYANIRHELDLIFYVTRTHAVPIQREEICVKQLMQFGWRTISCLAGSQANVLFASEHAPVFLRERVTTNPSFERDA
ncbi:DUF1780 domain-containing protein [Ferriphaselus sp. R-1]|uniref:DUF1780 domain-containing protein n=1 Tax=Ferriphaselus sp. R-1 TaxID=1485544 RepID=UPI0012695C31|nr:DUF1780 domain-containing protein [Ferriphaselus sp. R-1]